MNELLTALRPWVKEHSRISAHTLRRRFGITRAEADALIEALIRDGQLMPEPEGESYQVRYSRRTRKPRGAVTNRRDLSAVVRTTRERAQPARQPAEVA